MMNEVIVIGGGASGMVTAIIAARKGKKVTIIEQNNQMGKKILATGNGRCNYTNTDMGVQHYYSSEVDLLAPFLEEFPTKIVLDFFESIGIYPKNRGGYLYPFNDQAVAIREALQSEMYRLGVSLKWEEVVEEIDFIKDENSKSIIVIKTNKDLYHTNKCVLATGGNAGLGNKVLKGGFDLVENTKHVLTPLSPALCGLKSKDLNFKKLSGIRTDARVHILIDNNFVRSDIGELQLTDYGISGIPVFQISRIAGMALNEKRDIKVILDFIPNYSQEEFAEILIKRLSIFKGRKTKEYMNGLFKEKLASYLLEGSNLTKITHVCDITNEDITHFVKHCKNIMIKINGINDNNKAQVTAGGISLNEVNSNFESKLHKNLYFTGEVLDVDGICGGYNLHFAWASGIRVGMNI